ncbi:hypothetical protein PG997_011648 [Apiospora hydei]|uniref:F-box domain-containing protein n=1 Tax=Apiospora hydei TaxID=1337664 RepID=A0ABR1VJQ1_9PEZI
MDRLPREILAEVLEFLVGPAPTEYRLHDQPSDGLLESEVLDLKSASQVNKLWRGQALPILFRHVQWRPELSSLDGLDPVPLLRFLVGNRLQRNVITFTLLVDFADHQIESARVAYQIRPSDLEWLWDQLFAAIDPLRFTIIAPPATLAAFLNRMLFLDDAWSFNIPYHILSLARSHRGPRRDSENMLDLSSSPFGTSSSPPGASSSVAGSFKEQENTPTTPPLFPRTVVDFNYIAIFPLSSHISHLIHHLPKLDRFFVRFTPRPNNCILEDRQTLKQVDIADLWMERTTAFRHMLGEIVNDPGGGGGGSGSENWKTLNVFEIGEMEDAEVRALAHTYVDRAGSGWIVTDGVTPGAMVRVDEEGKPKGPSGAVVPHTPAVRHDVLHGPGWAVIPNYHFQPVL